MNPFIGLLMLACIPVYFLLRFIVVSRIQDRAVQIVLDRHNRAIEADEWNEDWADEDWHMLRSRYAALILDARKWTFKSFYPELS